MSEKGLKLNCNGVCELATETVDCCTGSAHPGAFGELCARYRCEKSIFGYNPSVLKSGIQKYARRAEVQKGLWCLIEMDLFSLLEWDGAALDAYLQKYPRVTRADVKDRSQKIRSNMVNRLVVMMSEEVSICAWWMPVKMLELYERWLENRANPLSRKYLVDIYLHLTSNQMIRLISDLNAVYRLLDPTKPVAKIDDRRVRQIHADMQERYPLLYADQAEMGEPTWRLDITKFPRKLHPCIRGIIYNLERGSDHVFYWISKLRELQKEDRVGKYRYLTLVWKILLHCIELIDRPEPLRESVCALWGFYKRIKNRERPIFLYHAVLLIVRRDEVDWNSKPSAIDTPIDVVEQWYADHLNGGKMPVDSYVLDMHTRRYKKGNNDLMKFAAEGAYVRNENEMFFNPAYRAVYVDLKQEFEHCLKGSNTR